MGWVCMCVSGEEGEGRVWGSPQGISKDLYHNSNGGKHLRFSITYNKLLCFKFPGFWTRI